MWQTTWEVHADIREYRTVVDLIFVQLQNGIDRRSLLVRSRIYLGSWIDFVEQLKLRTSTHCCLLFHQVICMHLINKQKHLSAAREREKREEELLLHRWSKWILLASLLSTVSLAIRCQRRSWQRFDRFRGNSSCLFLSSAKGWRR